MLHFIVLLSGFLPVLYAVLRYWKRTHVKVNCWFCGLNNTILKKCQDGWICKHCEQYNGFKPDGDYNRDIPAQWDSSLNGKISFSSKSRAFIKSSNGLCEECNRSQELKISQLASFQPINPENYDQEIENYSYHLERAYRLCPTCESVLEDTLSRKKTHVLDMNLQISGKRNLDTKSSSPPNAFGKALVQTSASMTTTIAITLALYISSSLASSNFLQLHDQFVGNEKAPEHLSSYSVSVLKELFAPPVTCPHQKEFLSSQPVNQFSAYLTESVQPYMLLIEPHLLFLALSGLAIQGVSSLLTGSGLTFVLWAVFNGTVFMQKYQLPAASLLHILNVSQVVVLLLILPYSWREMMYQPRSSPSKKQLLKLKKGKPESIHKFGKSSSDSIIHRIQASEVPAEPVLSRATSFGETMQDKIPIVTPNYLSLPSRPASVSSSHTLTSAAALNNSVFMPSIDVQGIGAQEDARSDASADSAFSNTDSITLDGAESLNASCQFILGKKRNSQDDDVDSLIEGLSIGPLSSRQSSKRSSEFKTKQYTKENKRSSVLSPSKLGNIMNESARSSIWRNRSSLSLIPASDVSESLNQTVKEPLNHNVLEPLNQTVNNRSSPCGSIHSRGTVELLRSPGSFSPQSSLQQIGPMWNAPFSPHRSLSVCVPPNPLASNPGFTSMSNPMSQVIYTPYGLYHQVLGPYGTPGMYMMSPQSPTLSTPSYTSQFSPQSFTTSSQKDMNSFCGSDTDFSPKSTKGRPRTRSALSSSFFESVWQSRFAIMYTTLCYLLLGFIVCAFSYSGFASKIILKVVDFKTLLSLPGKLIDAYSGQ